MCGVVGLVCLAGLASAPAWASDAAQSLEYDACMKAAIEDPEVGFDRATTWRELGGGEPAQHCAAVALYGLGHFGEAATRFERLANADAIADSALRASLLGQAGNAWLMAERAERAHAALSAAIALAPEDPELYIDRALALAAAENFWPALDDLDRALDLRPDDPNALVFRASTYRYLDSLELAAEDVNRALAIAPEHADALLERGILRRLAGDDAGARADWVAVLAIDPDGATAEAARRNLERMDVRTE